LEFSKIQNFKQEGQILPLGIHGEGLFKYIQHLSLDKNPKKWMKSKNILKSTFPNPDPLLQT
jgi:hypothetical protein